MNNMTRTDTATYTEVDIFREIKDITQTLKDLKIADITNQYYLVEFNNRKNSRVLGMCTYIGTLDGIPRYKITINKAYLQNSDPQSVHDTIAHEVLHSIPGCMNHGEKWNYYARQFMTALPQFNISRCGNNEGFNNYLKKAMETQAKYTIICKKCGARFYKTRKSQWMDYLMRGGKCYAYHRGCGGDFEVIQNH